MANFATPAKIMADYHYIRSTFYNRRNECLASDYSDAVILDGPRHTLIRPARWAEFVAARSKATKKEVMGL